MKDGNDWYYWTKTPQGIHCIVFRHAEDRIGIRGKITFTDGQFHFQVDGPCWSVGIEKGARITLEEARQEVENCVGRLIEEEFAAETS